MKFTSSNQIKFTGPNQVIFMSSNQDKWYIIITADHGEGFGEDGVYDHYCHVIHDVLRNVPWCRIET